MLLTALLGPLGTSWGRLGAILGPLGAFWDVQPRLPIKRTVLGGRFGAREHHFQGFEKAS